MTRALTPAEQHALTDVSRICRTCNVEKPIAEFRWRVSGTYRMRYQHCRTCLDAKKRIYQQRELRARKRLRIELSRPIPGSDPWLDLRVIELCWGDCVDAGAPAIERMMEAMIAATQRIVGARLVTQAARGYLKGFVGLGPVRSGLDELLALAVAS